MSRFNTGNPLGSGSPLDLDDNAKNMDLAINSDDPTWVDRLGRDRKSFEGLEREFDAAQHSREARFNDFISASGYQFLGDYGPGIEITEYNQLVRDENGEFWRVSGRVDLPYVTTGAGIPEGDALVPAGDAVLRQELGGGVRFLQDEYALKSSSGRFNGEIVIVPSLGVFLWRSENVSSEVSMDKQEYNFIAVYSDEVGASGAWQRLDYSSSTVTTHGSYKQPLSRAISNAHIASRMAKPALEVIAHRGFAAQFPQNTMLAFSLALESGADSLEFDVQVSADGELYVFHDIEVDALTNGSGRLLDLNSSYIDTLQFKALQNTPYSSERIPKLSEVLRFAKRKGVFIYPEAKALRSYDDISLILNAIKGFDLESMCMIQHPDIALLERARSESSEIWIGLLGSYPDYHWLVDRMSRLGRGGMVWPFTVVASNPEIVQYCKNLGVELIVFTVYDDVMCTELLDLGVYKQMADVSIGGLK